MNASSLLVSNQCVVLGRRALQQLRASLERDSGLQVAGYLQEAGFAGGEEMYGAFLTWLKGVYGVDHPAELDAARLGEVLSRFFSESGWGTLQVSRIAPSVLAFDSSDWSEADRSGTAQYPSCHLTSGLLSDFLGRIAEAVVGVMEVECVSRGESRCRFLAGAPDTLQNLYERMSQGLSYGQALGLDGA